jgi:hypothetical protein
MGLVGQHTAHILELHSSLQPRGLSQRRSRIALRQRSLLTPVLPLAAVPGVTRPVFAQRSVPTDVILVDRHIFEIAPPTISDTKVVFTIVGGKIVYEADAN